MLEWLAALPGLELFQAVVGHADDLVAYRACDVGGEEDVGQAVERGVGRGRLGVSDVQEGGEGGAGGKFGNQIGFVHGLAPARVDERGAVAQASEVGGVEHPDGLGQVGEVVADDAAPAEGVFEGHFFDAELGGGVFGQIGVEDEDLEMEGTQEADEDAANGAGAEQGDGGAEVALGAALFAPGGGRGRPWLTLRK